MSLDNAERPCFHLKVITYRIYKHHELILLKLKTRGGREWDKKRWIATLAQGFSVCLILWQGAHHRKLIALLQRGCLVHIKTHEDTKQGSRQTLPGAAVFSVDTWKSNNYFYVVTNDIFVAIEFILRSVFYVFLQKPSTCRDALIYFLRYLIQSYNNVTFLILHWSAEWTFLFSSGLLSLQKTQI